MTVTSYRPCWKAGEWRFQGGFPYTPIHGQIRPTPPPPFPRDARAEGLGDERLIGGLVIEPDLPPLHRRLR